MNYERKSKNTTRLRQYKSYPAYKDSGIEWLGEIPAHWDIKRLKFVAPTNTNKRDKKPDDSIYVGLEHIESCTGRLLLDNQPESVDSIVASFISGDVLFGKLRPYLAKVARPNCNGVCTSELLVLRPMPGCFQSYVMYCLLNATFIRWLDSLTYGTKMPRVSPGQVTSSYVPYFSITEQTTIANFLDRDTAKIDALVAKNERLIELLQGKRSALITRAVTKGLDPNVPMKNSGVEWLGEIPAHWCTESNRWLFLESDEHSLLGEEELLTVSHLTGVTRHSEKNVTMIEAESYEDYKICRKGELSINTMWAWMGALGIAKEDGMVSPSYNVYRIVSAALYPRYYDYLCRVPAHVTEITRLSKGIWSSRLRLYPDAFFEVRTPLPLFEEQIRIVAFLDRETAKIDALIAKIREAIARLKEYRTALISAAVTGKIDVREEVT
jgi:type I restriction enzyme S subunit